MVLLPLPVITINYINRFLDIGLFLHEMHPISSWWVFPFSPIMLSSAPSSLFRIIVLIFME